MKLYANTDIGQKRQINQDTFFINQYSDNAGFAIVCDGMGGQNAGNIASEIACKSITDLMIANDLSLVPKEEIKDFLISVISQGNLLVYEKSLENDDYFGMGTTLVLALVIDKNAYIAHIGDSRAYISNDKGLIQITKDHSLVQELVDQGKISKDEMASHPRKNMITRALGVNLSVDIDYIEVNLSENDKLLLCTDGLTNMCSDDLIYKQLKNKATNKVCDLLISLANKAGGLDNITVAIIE